MHTPGHNPFVEEYNTETQWGFNQDALASYLNELGTFFDASDINSLMNYQNNPTFDFGEGYDYDGYQYQGLNPEIFSALSNVFQDGTFPPPSI